jgi:hypothetical protein
MLVRLARVVGIAPIMTLEIPATIARLEAV